LKLLGDSRIRNGLGGPRLQDIGSQAIVPLLRLEPGQWFLDLCAAPGNKTAQALEAGVRAVACDLYPRRLAQLKALGIPRVALDGTRPLPFARLFDRILVDAPCSGTGTLGRNPEIKWRLRPEDLDDLSRRQGALLANARAALAPGGVLAYSTCSLEPEENEGVAASVPPELVVETMRRIPGREPGDGFYAEGGDAIEVWLDLLLAAGGVLLHELGRDGRAIGPHSTGFRSRGSAVGADKHV